MPALDPLIGVNFCAVNCIGHIFIMVCCGDSGPNPWIQPQLTCV